MLASWTLHLGNRAVVPSHLWKKGAEKIRKVTFQQQNKEWKWVEWCYPCWGGTLQQYQGWLVESKSLSSERLSLEIQLYSWWSSWNIVDKYSTQETLMFLSLILVFIERKSFKPSKWFFAIIVHNLILRTLMSWLCICSPMLEKIKNAFKHSNTTLT